MRLRKGRDNRMSNTDWLDDILKKVIDAFSNASPSGIVTLPNMDKETFKQFAAQWREGYEGPENAGYKVMGTEEEVVEAKQAILNHIDKAIEQARADEKAKTRIECEELARETLHAAFLVAQKYVEETL